MRADPGDAAEKGDDQGRDRPDDDLDASRELPIGPISRLRVARPEPPGEHERRHDDRDDDRQHDGGRIEQDHPFGGPDRSMGVEHAALPWPEDPQCRRLDVGLRRPHRRDGSHRSKRAEPRSAPVPFRVGHAADRPGAETAEGGAGSPVTRTSTFRRGRGARTDAAVPQRAPTSRRARPPAAGDRPGPGHRATRSAEKPTARRGSALLQDQAGDRVAR